MATKSTPEEEKLEETIRFRAPRSLRPRLKEIAKRKRTKYQAECRILILDFADREEARLREEEKLRRKAQKAKA